MIRFRNLYSYLIFSTCIFLFSQISWAVDIKELMYEDLDFIKSVYYTAYTPESWKKELFGWDLNEEIQTAKNKVEILDNNLIREYQKILRDFFLSMRDYHVGFRFCSTEESFLPFTVSGTNGKYFIANVLGSDYGLPDLPFSVGDEILKFGEKPTRDAVDELISQISMCGSATDTALAAILLTIRVKSMAVDVPNGPITVRIRHKKSNQVKDYRLKWFYTPELILNPEQLNNPPDIMAGSTYSSGYNANLVTLGMGNISSNNQSWINRNFTVPLWDHIRSFRKYENPHLLGTRKSYIPPLGRILWEINSSAHFHAYIYLNENYQKIGYIRIPHFGGSSREVKEFTRIIRFFEWFTDGLVIDQINNPGGSLFYLYALASILTDKPLTTPTMTEKINQDMVYSAIQTLKLLSTIKNEQEAKKYLGDDISGYPVTYGLVKSIMDYCEFIVVQWNSGFRITDKFPIMGIRKILPHQRFRYSKPIILVVNGLAFSGGDFFPAILQDNKRVTVLGTTTAGAGGYVLQQVYPNIFGISAFSFTGSLAYRLNDEPIENLGVTPDVVYHISEKDLMHNYPDYKNVINQTLIKILE